MKRLTYTLFALLILVSGLPDRRRHSEQATPLTIPKPVELSNTFSTLAKKLEPVGRDHYQHRGTDPAPRLERRRASGKQ